MTRRPKTVAELDACQRTVLAGLMARREYDQGFEGQWNENARQEDNLLFVLKFNDLSSPFKISSGRVNV